MPITVAAETESGNSGDSNSASDCVHPSSVDAGSQGKSYAWVPCVS